METRHVFTSVKQIALAQGEIVEKQASLGRSLLLVVQDFIFHVLSTDEAAKHNVISWRNTHLVLATWFPIRLTIMILDCSIWPGRALAHCLWILYVWHVWQLAAWQFNFIQLSLLFRIGSRCSIGGRELVPCSGSVRGQQLNLGFHPHATTSFICCAHSHFEPSPDYWEHMHCDAWMQWDVPNICLCACGSLISTSISTSMCTFALEPTPLCTSGHLTCKRSAWSTTRAPMAETSGRQTNTVPQPRQFATVTFFQLSESHVQNNIK